MTGALKFSVFRNYLPLRFNRKDSHYGGKYGERKAMAIVALGMFISECEYSSTYYQMQTPKNDEFDRAHPKFDKMSVFRFIKDDLVSQVPSGDLRYFKVTHDERYDENYNGRDANLLYIFIVSGARFGLSQNIYVKIGQEEDGMIYALSFHESAIATM